MKIAILGNGKMGKRIIKLAKQKGHTIAIISNSKKPTKSLNLNVADVAIDFSTPDTAFENISHSINSGIPVISGTTGWLDRLKEINTLCKKKNGAFLYSSNFSLGVNIFFQLNEQLAELIKKYDYKTKIHEIHHCQKLDSPSGTAITLAEQINKILKSETKITSERTNNTIGIHKINHTSKIDQIEIKHTAKNRDGFAVGAIMAAEWIKDKKGIYNMKDVLEENR